MQATQRAARREATERAAHLSALRLVATTSLLRTGTAWLLPRAGAAGWWGTLLCALPAAVVYLLLWGGMRVSREKTLRAALLARRGPWAEALLRAVTALCLPAEGLFAMTTLVTLLDEGVGIAVSPLALAVGTAALLAFCLVEDGLARGVALVRWPVVALLLWLVWEALPQMETTNLFPLLGEEEDALLRAVAPCVGGMWPVVLLVQVQAPEGGRRGRGWAFPLCAILPLLATTLVIPHEVLTLRTGLAESLLVPGAFLSAMGRTLLMCLWMLLMALSSVVCASGAARAARGCHAPWLAGGALAAFALAQGLGSERIVQALRAVQPWLLTPWLLVAALLFFPKRRKR